MILDELDKEIALLKGNLDPLGKTYRYDCVRLDVFELQRSVIELQEICHNEQIRAADFEQRLELQEMKTSLLEIALRALCKPEARNWLAIEVSEKIAEKFIGNLHEQ
jgi:hypothetical protein